jgi:Domain of unknown function (DUF6766)
MSNVVIVWTVVVVLLAVTVLLIGALVRDIQQQRRSAGVKRIWANFGLSIAFCVLFLVSWAAQGVAEWGTYRQEQTEHNEPVALSGYLVAFGQSTLENWQSEFLQLFSFVVLSSLLIHRQSAESKDSDERLEQKIDAIKKRLDELESAR